MENLKELRVPAPRTGGEGITAAPEEGSRLAAPRRKELQNNAYGIPGP